MGKTKSSPSTESQVFQLPLELISRLDKITNLTTLKLVLYSYACQLEQSGFSWEELVKDYSFSRHFNGNELESALTAGVEQGLFLIKEEISAKRYFPTMVLPQGTNPTDKSAPHQESDSVLGELFTVYETNIGPITPILADGMIHAREIYPAEWIKEAIEIAVKMNKRNWKYIEAILKRWKEEGYGTLSDRRNTEKSDAAKQIHNDLEEFLKGE
ncbi:MAG TPA: DnaD domain protein [Anaerolineales bacterium]|nr:DnaD domain protein [Anaerolineales bacterium]